MRFATLALCCCAATATAAPRAHVSLTQTGDAPGLFDTTAELLRRIDVDVSGGEDAGVDDVAVRLDVQDTQTLVTLSRARDGVHGVRHVRRASTLKYTSKSSRMSCKPRSKRCSPKRRLLEWSSRCPHRRW